MMDDKYTESGVPFMSVERDRDYYDVSLKLDSPITEEQWDILTDVDFDHTPSIWFHTKHGKDVEFVKVTRCKDCKYRIINEHSGEKGYMKLKAMCKLDTGDPFALGRYAEDDDWFCADGERKDDD